MAEEKIVDNTQAKEIDKAEVKQTDSVQSEDVEIEVNAENSTNADEKVKPSNLKFGQRVKNFFKEFGKFLQQGDVIDLAVAFVVGAAFRAIVSSLVADIIMPLVAAIGGVSVADLSVVLNYSADGTPNVLNYGSFIQTIIDFIIIAFAIFVALRTMIKMRTLVDKSAKLVKEKIEVLVVKDEKKAEK